MPRITHDNPDRVYACPECDCTREIYRRVEYEYTDKFEHEYICHTCGAEFDEPVDRECRENTPPSAYQDDGLPSALSPAAKQAVQTLKESGE